MPGFVAMPGWVGVNVSLPLVQAFGWSFTAVP